MTPMSSWARAAQVAGSVLAPRRAIRIGGCSCCTGDLSVPAACIASVETSAAGRRSTPRPRTFSDGSDANSCSIKTALPCLGAVPHGASRKGVYATRRDSARGVAVSRYPPRRDFLPPCSFHARIGRSSCQLVHTRQPSGPYRVHSQTMHRTSHSIKFDDRIWEMACEEACHLGMSTAEFIRGAVAARCFIARVRRDPAYAETLGDLYDAVDRYVRLTDDEAPGEAP